MKVSLFEVTLDCVPVIFANADDAADAVKALAKGLAARLGKNSLVYGPMEATIRRVELDVPRHTMLLLSGHAKLRRRGLLPEAGKGGAE